MVSSGVGERSLLPDTHAHLDGPEFVEDLDAVLMRAREAGVGPILAVGSDLRTSLKAVEIARSRENVFAAVGVHPHQAEQFTKEKDRVRALLDEDEVVAVGEIGLDHLRGAAAEHQVEAFQVQLRWARERGLPVSIHNRDATQDILAELTLEDRPVLHCFSGSWEDAEAALAQGCMLSFAGNLTFPKADGLRSVAERVPLQQILVESDAPVLAPQPKRGRRNEPAYVAMTADLLARIRQMPVDELARALRQNADRVFDWRVA
jgi:TatD DNase family protein